MTWLSLCGRCSWNNLNLWIVSAVLLHTFALWLNFWHAHAMRVLTIWSTPLNILNCIVFRCMHIFYLAARPFSFLFMLNDLKATAPFSLRLLYPSSISYGSMYIEASIASIGFENVFLLLLFGHFTIPLWEKVPSSHIVPVRSYVFFFYSDLICI